MFSEFMNWVDTSQVAKVTISGTEIRGATRGNDTFRTYSPSPSYLVPRLLEKGVQIDVTPGGSSPWMTLLYSWAPLLVIVWAFPLAILAVAVVMLRHIRRIDETLAALLRRTG
jgi:hypothetical protein